MFVITHYLTRLVHQFKDLPTLFLILFRSSIACTTLFFYEACFMYCLSMLIQFFSSSLFRQ